MDILYCSRCNRSIPPGGPDEGRYFRQGEDIICPKCYHKARPHEHSGDTVPVEPLKDESLLGGSRITPAVANRTPRPTTRVGPAAKQRKTSTRVMPAARPASSHVMPAARRPSSKGSARLKSGRTSNAGLRTALVLLLMAVLGGLLAWGLSYSRRRGTERVGEGGSRQGSGGQTHGGAARHPGQTDGGAPGAGPGSGTGLRGEYFNGRDFRELKLTRIDPVIDFSWNSSPCKGVAKDAFSVRWTGRVEAERSELYTFQTLADDGARLWIDGRLLVNDWRSHPPEEHGGSIRLEAGRRYDITLELFDNVGGSTIRLFWSSPSTPKRLVPTGRLYPPAKDGTPQAQTGPGSAPIPEPGPNTEAVDLKAGLVGHWKLDEDAGDDAADSSGGGHNGRLQDGPVWEKQGRSGGALRFAGKGGHVLLPEDLAVKGDALTLAAWVRHDKTAGGGQCYLLLEPGKAGLRLNTWSVPRLEFHIKTGGRTRVAVSENTPAEDKWIHVAGTWDGTTQCLYRNGKLLVKTAPGDHLDAGGGGGHIGAPAPAAMCGLIDDVRVYDRALSPAEVAAMAADVPAEEVPAGR